MPRSGRAFEYLSEDPMHAGAFAAGVVEGIQSHDVIATPYHFVANNQEHGRVRMRAEVRERAIRERDLPAFRSDDTVSGPRYRPSERDTRVQRKEERPRWTGYLLLLSGTHTTLHAHVAFFRDV